MFVRGGMHIIPAKTLSLKVGEQVFKLEGSNGNFTISEEIQIALKNVSE